MLFAIPDLLTAEQVAQIQESLSRTEFKDGRPTAGLGSRGVKNNLQVTWDDASQNEIRKLVLQALERNQAFQFLALPQKILPPTFNRYESGMYYGDHVDHSILGKQINMPIRSDISTTIFLSDPSTYDGGELVITRDGLEHTIKLPAGQAIVYSATCLHRVNAVTRGARIAAVTSAQSMIKDETQRDVLGELAKVTRWVQDTAPDAQETVMLGKIYANLIRMWAEI
ncbi:MAG: Fe2+-dependent dioxygenase [Gammaproteobacteria bacterium]|nr:Fe2+-dependent dioxygenase [Gammaproteobacteria bacterium]